MKLKTFAVLIMLAIILFACSGEEPDQVGQELLSWPTLEPTPTLVSGIPTSTPILSTAESTSTPKNGLEVAPVNLATATSQMTPTATPPPIERFEQGEALLFNENYDSAVGEFQAGLVSGELDPEQRQEALIGLGQAQLYLGNNQAAIETFEELLADSTSSLDAVTADAAEQLEIPKIDTVMSDAPFFLAQAQEREGNCDVAIMGYELYLASHTDMEAYIQPLIANCHLALGNRAAAVWSYEVAAAADSHRITNVRLRENLAEMYVEDGRYDDALAQYDAILEIAQTDATRGQITYQAGSVELLAGNSDLGYERYLTGINDFPQAYESYQALVTLIEAGYEVDQFQRGLVDFHAKAYEPAIEAFNLYIEANPVHREDVHLFLAWSHEGLGDISAALGQIDTYIEANSPADIGTDEEKSLPDNELLDEDSEGEAVAQNNTAVATGWIEKAKLQRRAGLVEDAIASYLNYLELFPEGNDAPLAAWWAAALTERSGDIEGAVTLYQQLANSYPNHEDAAESLFRAGYLSWLLDDADAAEDFWLQAVEKYPHREYGAAAWNWLSKTISNGETLPIYDEAGIRLGEGYYSLRAQDIASGTMPFEPADGIEFDPAQEEQIIAEAWLRQRLGLEPDTDVRSLSNALAEDGRLIRGRKLWNLGFRAQAKRELESLRNESSDDALASYQLALFFRDLGLYRSSILAATSVMRKFEATVFEAPTFIARLAYPVYYADLIAAESETYDYDPLLQFALVRQESLFESFATSSAVAQGLSQVIPDTGAYIAQRLGWQDYVNEDLYRLYVGIAFGAFYLDQQLDGFDGNIAAALSAYNAGPGNAARWYGQAPDDIDQYIEIIDFAETRQYVERIFSGHAIYRYLYGDN